MGDPENGVLGLRDLLVASKTLTGDTYSIKGSINKKILNNYYTKLSKEIKSSFEKSLYFTASRIPAQSHQSFM